MKKSKRREKEHKKNNKQESIAVLGLYYWKSAKVRLAVFRRF